VSVPRKLRRCAAPPTAADSFEETPRNPKSWQLEGEQRRIAGAHEGFADDLLDGAGERSNGDGVPDLQEDGFGPVGEPIEFRVGVFDGDESVLTFDDGAFLDGANAEGQAPAVLGVERFEAFVIEGFRVAAEVGVGDAAGPPRRRRG